MSEQQNQQTIDGLHSLELRVTRLEDHVETMEDKLNSMINESRAFDVKILSRIDEILESLNKHVQDEEKQKVVILWAVVTGLVGVILAAVTVIGPWIFNHIMIRP